MNGIKQDRTIIYISVVMYREIAHSPTFARSLEYFSIYITALREFMNFAAENVAIIYISRSRDNIFHAKDIKFS